MEVYIMYGVTYMEVLHLYGYSGLLSIDIAVYLRPYKCGTYDVVCVCGFSTHYIRMDVGN